MLPKKKPPVVRDVPPAKEMEDWVLVALQDLWGKAHFKRIDAKVKELLKSRGVPEKKLSRKVKHTRVTSLSLKTSAVRTELKKRGLLEIPAKGRHWQLTASGETRANFVRRELGLEPPKAPVVNNLAREARIKPDAYRSCGTIMSLRKSWSSSWSCWFPLHPCL